jgi:hypothetical protein
MSDPTLPVFDSSSITQPTDASMQTSRRAIVSSRLFIVVWRVLIVLAALIGIVLDSNSINGFINRLVFFTIQSNLMLMVCIGYAAWTTLRKTPGPGPVLKGAITVYILITGLVFNLILAKSLGPPPAGSISVPLIGGTLNNDLLHIITPIMALVDWLLFDIHGRLRWGNALLWLTYPLAYLAFVLVRGVLVSGPFLFPYVHYPYSFLDVDYIGYGGVALDAVIYGIAFWLIGLVFVLLDRTLARLNHR